MPIQSVPWSIGGAPSSGGFATYSFFTKRIDTTMLVLVSARICQEHSSRAHGETLLREAAASSDDRVGAVLDGWMESWLSDGVRRSDAWQLEGYELCLGS